MSFSAKFVIDGLAFNVLTCDYGLHQPTNSRGKSIASVRSGLIRISLEVQGHHELFTSWASETNQEKSGQIVFNHIDSASTFKVVGFEEGHLVSYREIFTPYSGASSFRIDLGITANFIQIGSAFHHNLW